MQKDHLSLLMATWWFSLGRAPPNANLQWDVDQSIIWCIPLRVSSQPCWTNIPDLKSICELHVLFAVFVTQLLRVGGHLRTRITNWGTSLVPAFHFTLSVSDAWCFIHWQEPWCVFPSKMDACSMKNWNVSSPGGAWILWRIEFGTS